MFLIDEQFLLHGISKYIIINELKRKHNINNLVRKGTIFIKIKWIRHNFSASIFLSQLHSLSQMVSHIAPICTDAAFRLANLTNQTSLNNQ